MDRAALVKIGGGKRQAEQSMGKIRMTVDAGDRGWQDNVDLAQLGALRHDRETLLWLDITDPGPAEIDLLRREFDFHELALEDVAKLEFHQRPRCDRYEGYYFIVLYAAERSADKYVPRELQMFWGERFLITIHNGDLAIVSQARGRWLRHDGRQHHSVAYMAYALCDALVDGYFPVQDWLEDRVEAIEEAVLTGKAGTPTDLYLLRKELLRVRRLLSPTGAVIAEVIRRERSRIPESLEPYLADMQDHLLHVLGELDGYRELLSAAQDVHSESMFGRLALVVQRLTAITVIIMVPNLLASIYGMNFDLLFPPSDLEIGFFVIVAVIGCMIVWGFIHSRLLGWL
jgi:magnesium transporter